MNTNRITLKPMTLSDVTRTSAPTATDKQLSFIHSLIDERLDEDRRATSHRWADSGISVGTASRAIERLLTYPKQRTDDHSGDTTTVPAGRYALEEADGVRFYVVTRRGRLMRQASDELYPPRGAHQRRDVIRRLAEDLEGASSRYGRLLGRCGVCGRTLTNDESRARGVGPVCAHRSGW